jgi:PAS domain S-box-containing protein
MIVLEPFLTSPTDTRSDTPRDAATEDAERLRNERALRASEERYRGLAEQVVDGIFVADSHGRFVDANRVGCEMLGYALAELKTLTIEDSIAPEEIARLPEQIRLLATGQIIRNEWRFKRKDGSIFDGELVARQLPDGRLQGVVRDLTEQRRSAHALLRRLEFERFLFELSRTFIGLPEAEVGENMERGLARVGEFLEMDRVTLFEVSPDRAEMTAAYSWTASGAISAPPMITKRAQPWWVGQVLRGVVSLASHVDDLPAEAAAEKQYLRQRGVASAASIPLEVGGEIAGAISFVTVRRHVTWTEELVSQLRAFGDILWNALKRRDAMTLRRDAERALRESEALRASEDRYRGLAEQVVDGIFVADAEGRCVDANSAACELLGYTLDELRALRIEDVLVADERPRLLDQLQHLGSRQVVRSEWRFRRSNGSVFTGELVGRQLPDGRLQGVVRDVTERKEAEEVQRRLHQLVMLPLEAKMEDVLVAVLDMAIDITHADFGNIKLLDPRTSRLNIAACRGFPQWWVDYWTTVPDGRGTSGMTMKRRERVIVEDVELSPIFTPDDLDAQRKAGVRAVQSTPLVLRSGQLIGTLSTHFTHTGRPDEHALLLLDLLAREAADIIGHLRSEKEQKRQAALLDLASSSIFVHDRDGIITYWNDGAVRCYGWSKQEALGKVSYVLLQTEFPEPLERILDVTTHTGRWEGELVHTCRDGRQITVYSRWAILLDVEGEGFGVLQIDDDITARKRAEAAVRDSEQQLQSYIEQAGDGIYVLDGESGRILNANTRASQMTGYTHDELLRLSAADIECDHRPVLFQDFPRRERQGVVAVEGTHRRKDGSTFPVEISMTLLAPTPPYRILAIVRDVSERKRLERERADEARRKDEFLAFLGHELRNPLAAIHTAIEVLSSDASPVKQARMKDIIRRQTAMMRRLVDDLLELERITHGHIELKLSGVDLAECLQRAAAAVQATVDDRKQTLALRVPAESVQFMADGTRLDQILGNLLRNASKYTQPGGHIELSGDRADDFVVIRCKDNGQGIPVEYQKKIFEPFSRGLKTELGYGEASVGLGLALVKQLTELHGGTISVESRGAGLGSEFTVRLPLVTPSPVDVPTPAAALPRTRSIVVVEDNPSVCEALEAALELAGHSVHVFADGPSTLAAVATLKPDVLLIDIGLPGMDGYELAAALEQLPNTKDALRIAMSGFKRRDQEAGDAFRYYFSKPIDVPALLALLAQS